MDIQASLEALCSCPGPSGREDAVASQAMELLRPLMDEVKKDRFGNVIGIRRCGTENAKRVVLDAHLDEVGLVITGAKDGFLRFRPVGGVDPRMLPNREVIILSQPPQFGLVAVLPPHVQKAGDSNRSTPLSGLYIDAGLTQKEGEALVGTFVVPREPFRALLGRRVSSKALDDRAGFVTLLRAAELLRDTPLDVDLYLMGSSREETNGGGAGGRRLFSCAPLFYRRGCHPRPYPRFSQGRNFSRWRGNSHWHRPQYDPLDDRPSHHKSRGAGHSLVP